MLALGKGPRGKKDKKGLNIAVIVPGKNRILKKKDKKNASKK